MSCMSVCAASARRLEAVQFLHQECGLELTEEALRKAAGSGNVGVVEWMLQAGCPVGRAPYLLAAKEGDVGMVRWLVEHVDISWAFKQDTPLEIIFD